MKREKLRTILIVVLKELIFFLILLAIAWFTSWKAGWTDTAIIDNVIGVTIGWAVWRLILFVAKKRKDKKETTT